MAAVGPAGPDPTMTTLASTRPSALRTVDGPSGCWVVASSTIEIEKPPDGFELMTAIVARDRYSPGVSRETSKLGDDVAADDVEGTRVGQAAEGHDHVLGAGVGQVAEAGEDMRSGFGAVSLASRDVHALKGRMLDLGRVATDRRAMLGEDRVLA